MTAPAINPTQKVCRKCERLLDIDCFYARNKFKDGFENYCKDCIRAYHREHNKNRVKVHRQRLRQNGKKVIRRREYTPPQRDISTVKGKQSCEICPMLLNCCDRVQKHRPVMCEHIFVNDVLLAVSNGDREWIMEQIGESVLEVL